MLDLTTLGEMTPEQRTEEFDRLFQELWPESTNRALTAETKLGVTKPTYFRWRREHLVPDLVILLMQEWATVSKETNEWRDVTTKLSGIAQTIEDLTGQIGQLSQSLAAIADHHAHAPEQNALSAQVSDPASLQSSPE